MSRSWKQLHKQELSVWLCLKVELVSVTVEVDEERVACVAVVIADYCIRRAGGYRRRCVGVVVAVGVEVVED